MNQALEAKSRLENESGASDASTLPLYQAVTHALLRAITCMKEGRVQYPSPCKKNKRREPSRAYPM
jgi:hypothetical protein